MNTATVEKQKVSGVPDRTARFRVVYKGDPIACDLTEEEAHSLAAVISRSGLLLGSRLYARRWSSEPNAS